MTEWVIGATAILLGLVAASLCVGASRADAAALRLAHEDGPGTTIGAGSGSGQGGGVDRASTGRQGARDGGGQW